MSLQKICKKFLPKIVKEKIIEFRNNNLDGYGYKVIFPRG